MTAVTRAFVAFASVLGFICMIARPSQAFSDPQARQLAASCASCHRPDGHDTGIPSLAGLNESRIMQSMLAYRSGERASQIMHVVAGALSPEEITGIARYLAGQQAMAAPR